MRQSSDDREWVRLVALRHDLLLWRPDTRSITGRFSVPYVGQGWLKEALDHVPLPLAGHLFLETMHVSDARVVRASGVWEVGVGPRHLAPALP